MTWELRNGDCMDQETGLPSLPDSSVSALITDPPAGISFMGKEWDSDKGGRQNWVAWMAGVMRECLRVLKPGAHGFVWALPRTSHWTATALEDAGFEIRDVVTHHFGTGFPKSLDVSKAIGAAAGAERKVVGNHGRSFRPHADDGNEGWWRPSHDTHGSITAPATPAAKQWAGWGTALKPATEHWILVEKRCECVCHVQSAIEHLTRSLHGRSGGAGSPAPMPVESNSGETRLQVAATESTRGDDGSETTVTSPSRQESEVTASSTISSSSGSSDVACGEEKTSTTSTGSKTTTERTTCSCCRWANTPRYTPAENVITGTEHYILVRKPLEGTVAANVQRHGTGALNIDACRIDFAAKEPYDLLTKARPNVSATEGIHGGGCVPQAGWQPGSGRWPANLVLTHGPDCGVACAPGCPVAELDAQGGVTVSSDRPRRNTAAAHNDTPSMGKSSADWTTGGYADAGAASRFFYVAKPARSERDAGCGSLTSTSGGEATGRNDGSAGTQSPRAGAGRTGGARNFHPTVKPTELMEWLIRLITPPGGSLLILDPFAGSGTTGVASVRLCHDFIGWEKNPAYCAIAELRIKDAEPRQIELFK